MALEPVHGRWVFVVMAVPDWRARRPISTFYRQRPIGNAAFISPIGNVAVFRLALPLCGPEEILVDAPVVVEQRRNILYCEAVEHGVIE